MNTKTSLFFVLAMFLVIACNKDEPTSIESCDFEINFDLVFNQDCKPPCEVSFINNTTNATSYFWNFGDGTTSNEMTPQSKIYDAPGTYEIKLSASSGNCEETLKKEITVNWITFKKTYGGLMRDIGRSVQQTIDNGYIVLGLTKEQGNGSRDFYLIKTDINGDVVWEKKIDNSSSHLGGDLLQTTDGNFIIAGNVEDISSLTQTDNSGSEIWTKKYQPNTLGSFMAVTQTSDEGFISTGYLYEDNHPLTSISLLKTDEHGNEQWLKKFTYPSFSFGEKVIETSDGGYILTGSVSYFLHSNHSEVIVIKTNSEGETNTTDSWIKTYGNTGGGTYYGLDIIQTTDGGFMVIGLTYSGVGKDDIYLLKINNDGSIAWEKTIGTSEYYERGVSILQKDDGGFIIAGTKYIGGNNYITLNKIDKDANIEWTQNHITDKNNWARYLKPTNDGGYIIVGSTGDNSDEEDVMIIKTDDLGNCFD